MTYRKYERICEILFRLDEAYKQTRMWLADYASPHEEVSYYAAHWARRAAHFVIELERKIGDFHV